MRNKHNWSKAQETRIIQLYHARLFHCAKNVAAKQATANIANHVGCEATREAVIAFIKSGVPPKVTHVSPSPAKPVKQKRERPAVAEIPAATLGKEFYDTWEWKEARYVALKRHGRRCLCCGWEPGHSTGNYLVVDHIKPIRTHPQLALDPENHQVLCNDCNKGKSFRHHDDFR